MPSRYYQRIFIKGYYYHLFNRGANKENVFKDEADYQTFINIIGYYLTLPNGQALSVTNINSFNDLSKVPNLNTIVSSVNLCAFCLMPNHFHLIIKQQEDPTPNNSITNLMRRVTITYSMYFQKKYEHSGALFQGKFKNVLVDSDIQLLQLSKYIHRNPLKILGSEPLENYDFSSYKYFVNLSKCPRWLETGNILDIYSKSRSKSEYKLFVDEEPTFIEDDLIHNLLLE